MSITARQGQTLIASQQAPVILRIADLSTMTVQTQVSEADVSRLKLGMPAYFTTLGGSGRRWEGTLNKIEPTPVVQNNVVLYNLSINDGAKNLFEGSDIQSTKACRGSRSGSIVRAAAPRPVGLSFSFVFGLVAVAVPRLW